MKFQKGVSGNPGGRKKLSDNVKEALDALTMPALEVLKRALESQDLRLAKDTAIAVLERNLGKPIQALEHSGAGGSPLGITVTYVEPKQLKG